MSWSQTHGGNVADLKRVALKRVEMTIYREVAQQTPGRVTWGAMVSCPETGTTVVSTGHASQADARRWAAQQISAGVL